MLKDENNMKNENRKPKTENRKQKTEKIKTENINGMIHAKSALENVVL